MSATGDIFIFGAYKEWCGDVSATKKTSSTLFHELIHTTKKYYPDCFWKLGKSLEESSTEDGEIKVFGRKYAQVVYEDSYGYGTESYDGKPLDDCIYEIVCYCKELCKFPYVPPGEPPIDQCKNLPPDYKLPGADNPDDNESMSSGITRIYNLAPRSLVLKRGYWPEASKLFGGLFFDGNNSAEELMRVSRVLVIPTAALSQVYGDSVLRAVVEKYVMLGGNLVVMSQQHGTQAQEFLPGERAGDRRVSILASLVLAGLPNRASK